MSGDEKSAARLITLIENGEKEGYEELIPLLPHAGRAHVLGVTGPAGAGKSTLIASLVGCYRSEKRKVGIIAVDPTSVQSQGALLGDRVRMKDIEAADEVFVRSMADRGNPGGVSRATFGAVQVMEAFGKTTVIIESVGAGQSDKLLHYLCDSVVTVFTPEFGDELQLLKAGLLEIGDIVVINKVDKDKGSGEALSAISAHVGTTAHSGWAVPVLCTRADTGEGIEHLALAIDRRWNFLCACKEAGCSRRTKTVAFLMTLLKEELWQRCSAFLSGGEAYAQIVRQTEENLIDPYTAAERIGELIEKRLRGESE